VAFQAASPLGLFPLLKQFLHNTGLPWVGLNGTMVGVPQLEHVTRVSVWRRPGLLFDLHWRHRFGTFVNPFSSKNCCSPAENTNIAPQS